MPSGNGAGIAKDSAMTNDTIIRNYRCARCWGALVEKYLDGMFVVVCAADPAHEGKVTQGFVEHRRAINNLEAAEVGSIYAELLELPRRDLKAASQALYGDDPLV